MSGFNGDVLAAMIVLSIWVNAGTPTIARPPPLPPAIVTTLYATVLLRSVNDEPAEAMRMPPPPLTLWATLPEIVVLVMVAEPAPETTIPPPPVADVLLEKVE